MWSAGVDKFSLDVDGAEIADCYHGNFPVPWCPRHSIAPSEVVPALHRDDPRVFLR